MFESGAIMMYLAEKANKLYPQDWNKRAEVHQWLFFMNGKKYTAFIYGDHMYAVVAQCTSSAYKSYVRAWKTMANIFQLFLNSLTSSARDVDRV